MKKQEQKIDKMIKTATRLIIVILIIVWFAACSALKVHTDYDKTANFDQFRTFEYYGWAENSDKILNDIEKGRIENAFDAEFANRNLKHVEENGDLLISLYIVTEQKTQKTATTTHMGGGIYDYYGYGPAWGLSPGMSTTHYNEYNYTVGTLVVSVYDKKAQQLVWESRGVGTVDEDPKRREWQIPIIAKRIMKDFPVKPVKK